MDVLHIPAHICIEFMVRWWTAVLQDSFRVVDYDAKEWMSNLALSDDIISPLAWDLEEDGMAMDKISELSALQNSQNPITIPKKSTKTHS